MMSELQFYHRMYVTIVLLGAAIGISMGLLQ
jgi:hypothetical protein